MSLTPAPQARARLNKKWRNPFVLNKVPVRIVWLPWICKMVDSHMRTRSSGWHHNSQASSGLRLRVLAASSSSFRMHTPTYQSLYLIVSKLPKMWLPNSSMIIDLFSLMPYYASVLPNFPMLPLAPWLHNDVSYPVWDVKPRPIRAKRADATKPDPCCFDDYIASCPITSLLSCFQPSSSQIYRCTARYRKLKMAEIYYEPTGCNCDGA